MLLDNGRTAVLADEVGRAALHCIRCSACLNVCPVYERTGGHAYGSVYPGPIGAILSPQLTGVEDNASLPYASTLCGACFDACPVRIDIPSHPGAPARPARRGAARGDHRVPTAEAAGDGRRVLGDGRPAAVRAGRAGAPAGPAARPPPAAADPSLPPPLSAWTASRDVPAPPTETFRDWWARTRGGREQP